MIKVKIKEIASQYNIKNAYQLQKLTGFSPSKAANCWEGEWKRADLETLNTLCNLFGCMPNDILEFTPDKVEEWYLQIHLLTFRLQLCSSVEGEH